MSKNITIKEGTVDKSFTASKLKTNLVGGGTCLWIPEDELGTKTITKDGTYNATDDGYYGYETVIVNVGGGGSGGCPRRDVESTLDWATMLVRGETHSVGGIYWTITF